MQGCVYECMFACVVLFVGMYVDGQGPEDGRAWNPKPGPEPFAPPETWDVEHRLGFRV